MGKVVAIITAGGSGKRLQTKIKKQFLHVHGRPLLFYTLDKFIEHPQIDDVIITLPQTELDEFQKVIDQEYPAKRITCILGGTERQDSVFNALSACPFDTEIVLIHDGVRPFIKAEEISDLIKIAENDKAVIPVSKIKNTIKKIDNGKILKTIPREDLVSALTPQVFQYKLILEMHKKAKSEELNFTDDAAILEHYGIPVSALETSAQNIKITDAFDLKLAEILLK
jgi:2-C-methyl-D-erythritol 4-phosphate cytidylyltransferase